MVLYKYVSAERIDILQNRLIRFTQPNAMNDPFEARPYFEAFATKEGFAKAFADGIRQKPSMWAYLRGVTQTKMELQAFAEKLEIDPDYADLLYKDAGLPNPLPNERDRVYRLFNKNVGILSLSVTPDNLLM